MRFLIRLLPIVALSPMLPAQEGFRFDLFTDLRIVSAEGPAPWIQGGPGRLAVGGDDTEWFGQAQFALHWEPSLYFKAYLHGVARAEPDQNQGDQLGLTEFFIQSQFFAGAVNRFRIRLGMMLPPSSLENINPLWSSPYTQTFSTLNTWLGEEVRFNGLELSYQYEPSDRTVWFLGATLFGGNDTMGTLLAWRGWAMSDRLTLWRETIPLPDLDSLSRGAFSLQQASGSMPFGEELDDRLGYMVHGGVESGPFLFNTHFLNNRGDRGLHEGEYAWSTDYGAVGASFDPDNGFAWNAEWLWGTTGMGEIAGPHVEVDFSSWYTLASYQWSDWRFSLRYEEFETKDLDREMVAFNPDLNDETGDAITAALFWEPAPRWRIGLEWLDMLVERPTLMSEGFRTIQGGRALSASLRFTY